MNMLSEIQHFIDSEQADPRPHLRIFGYHPYYGFRRMEFERVVKRVGLGTISRKSISLKDTVYRALHPFAGLQRAQYVSLINGNDKILKPRDGALVLSYYSPLVSAVKLESVRLLCHALALGVLPLWLWRLSKHLTIKQQLLYIGDAIYFIWAKTALSIVSPDVLELTVSYSHYPIIAAAKSLDIPVVELQHGAISHCHIGYSGKIERYFPDSVLPMDDKWAEYLAKTPLPLNPSMMSSNWVALLPELTFTDFVSVYRSHKVLIIGQETVHRELYEIYERMLSAGLDAVYRHHPRVKLEPIPLDEQVKNSDVIVGSYSTVLVTHAGQKDIVLADVAGSEFLDILRGHDNVRRLTLN